MGSPIPRTRLCWAGGSRTQWSANRDHRLGTSSGDCGGVLCTGGFWVDAAAVDAQRLARGADRGRLGTPDQHQRDRSEIGRILDEAEIKPHRVRSWCHSEDPQFQEKMRAIVRLYVSRPSGEPVLCIDEKTGMQALSRSRQLSVAQPGRAGRMDFEYKRNGTRCLFACFNTGTGKVLARCTETRTRADFFSFIDEVASVYRQSRVHIVLDNLNTHTNTSRGSFIDDWNRRHRKRFVFHYTPTHGSWLNQVELWFAIVSRRVLRYGNFHSPGELVNAIEAFVRRWNRCEAHPFRWTYEGLPLVR